MNSPEDDSRFVAGDGPVNRRTALLHERQARATEEPPAHTELAERLHRAHARTQLGTPLADYFAAPPQAHVAPSALHIATSVLAAGGAVLGLLGVIQSAVLPLAAGAGAAVLGAVGWWRTRPARPASSAALFDTEALQAFDRALEAAAPELGEQATQRLLQTKEAFRRMGHERPTHDEHFTVEDRLFLRECLRRYLPDTLQAYLRVPAAQRRQVLHEGQPSAHDALLQQLALLHGEILAALAQPEAARAALEKAVRLTRAGFGPRHSHTRRAEISLARLQAQQGDQPALARLVGLGDHPGGDLEQRKAAWLARAYAADLQCAERPRGARLALDAVLADMRPLLPEGGAIPREVQRLRGGCGSARPGGGTVATR